MILRVEIPLLLCAAALAADTANTLSEAERQAGLRLLFDGHTLEGWEPMRPDADGRWVVEDGCMVPKGRPRELMTSEQYGDFELIFDWKIAKGGNSGVMYRVERQYPAPSSGPEYQLLDDETHSARQFEDRRTGAAYGIYPPERSAAKPAGEWNTARIVVRQPFVEHWLNGVKVLQYELHSPDWTRRVAKSKFAKQPQYGRAARGHIVLQDHASAVWFRNLKLRPLK